MTSSTCGKSAVWELYMLASYQLCCIWGQQPLVQHKWAGTVKRNPLISKMSRRLQHTLIRLKVIWIGYFSHQERSKWSVCNVLTIPSVTSCVNQLTIWSRKISFTRSFVGSLFCFLGRYLDSYVFSLQEFSNAKKDDKWNFPRNTGKNTQAFAYQYRPVF